MWFPTLISALPFMGTQTVRSWERVTEHRVFRDPAPDKVVFLGASYFGERYCNDHPQKVGGLENDACILANILNWKKNEFPELSSFKFFHFAMGGTYAQAHLYYLLQLLKIKDGSLKYIIFDGPRKFYLNLKSSEYFALHEKLLEEISKLPESSKTDRLNRFEKALAEQIKRDKDSGLPFTKVSTRDKFQKVFQAKRDWFGEFLAGVKTAFGTDVQQKTFEDLLVKHDQLYGNRNRDEFDEPMTSYVDSDFFNSEEDFDFLAIMLDLCKANGIKLVLYYSPSRKYYSSTHPEPYDSHIHKPVREYFEPRGMKFMDYRNIPFLVPRDSIDGIHPALSTKLVIAGRMLEDLRKYANEKQGN
jgi:hypothetical protein